MFYSIPPEQLLFVPGRLPPENETTLPIVVSITTVLLAFALVSYTSRIWIRWRTSLGLDDLTMTIAMLFTLTCYGITLAIAIITGGKHTVYVDIDDLLRNAKISFVFVIVWIWSVTMVKISVCCMLLRVKSYSRNWTIGLWTLIAVLFSMAISVSVTHVLMCQPIRANWDLSMIIQPGHCWSVDRFVSFTYGYSAFFVLTDVICALLPVVFIWKINRPLRERIVLGLLMALGMLASFCGIMKMVDLKPSINSRDPLYDAAPTQIWALAEAFVGIFAANIPSLRRPLERAFRFITGKTVDSITSINRRIHDSKNSRNDVEMSRQRRFSNNGEDAGYHSTVYAGRGKTMHASEEQLTALPKACFVKQEFEIRGHWNDFHR